MTKKRSQVRKDDVERKTEKKAAVTDKGTATSAEAQSLESEQTTGLGDSDSEPTVPWDLGKTTEVMLLWLFAFFTLRSCIWRIGMWLLRISSEAQLTASGLAGFTLSLDLSMLVATMFILKQSLREYRPLRERGLFPLHFRGRWWVYVLLSCLFIPMVDWLGTRIMVAFPNEMDGLPSTTEVQLAKGHTMTNVLYFILLSLCAPLWEENRKLEYTRLEKNHRRSAACCVASGRSDLSFSLLLRELGFALMDVDQFSDASFSAKAWVNAACARRAEGEPLERYLAELEMKLQLSCEDIEAALEDCSAQVLRRIPTALQEVARIQGEADGLRFGVQGLVGKLKHDHTAGSQAIAGLLEVDRVKRNVEAACNTLQEATELSELFARVDSIFAAGDVTAMANTLATMRRGLDLVGDVPEFRGGRQKLKNLEDSLVARIEPRLSSALAQKKGEQVRVLAGLLLSIGHDDMLQRLYASTWLQQQSGPRDALASGLSSPSASPKALCGALRQWHDSLMLSIEVELQWCDVFLPEQSSQLVVCILMSAIEESNRMLSSLLSQRASVLLSMDMQKTALDFFYRLARLLVPLTEYDKMAAVACLLYEPFEVEVQRFAALEKETLRRCIDGIASISEGAGLQEGEGAEPMVDWMAESHQRVLMEVEGTLNRCLEFTGGTELAVLVPVLDSTIQQHCGNLVSQLKSVRNKVLGGSRGGGPVGDDKTRDLGAVLQLLRLASQFESQVKKTNKSLSDAVVGITPKLVAAKSDQKPNLADLTVIRLQNDQRKAAQLSGLIDDAQGPRFAPLSTAQMSLAGFKAAVEALVFDVLMDKLRQHFLGISTMKEWNAAGDSSGLDLPKFSAYPLQYVKSTGEYLMMLPQQLEALVGAEEDVEVDAQEDCEGELASLWLDKVVTGAAELYVDELLRVPILSASGCAQLLADVEYFGNVLSAMGFPRPDALAAVQKAASMPLGDLEKAAGGTGPKTGGASAVLAAVAKMRGAAPH
ncbi:unnamed protein product [Ostreobium quekettii]|uniref:Conserved oligomeric Golgi complex subunit 7 n=1 Tax=Ostreobium quekettii TaxID=121088 RepID=A0A8S1J1G3_9CHLO|nr:unnamed protein product [Ostreobium quekettii]